MAPRPGSHTRSPPTTTGEIPLPASLLYVLQYCGYADQCATLRQSSLRSVALIAAVLGRAGQRGQERRLKEAGEGRATWDVSPDVRKYVKKQVAQQLETARQADEAGAEANSMPSGPAHDQRKHDVKESLVKLG